MPKCADSPPNVFPANTPPLVSGTNETNLPAFFRRMLTITGLLSPLEAPLGIADVLGTDPFYAGSYSNVRWGYRAMFSCSDYHAVPTTLRERRELPCRYDDFQFDNSGSLATPIRGVPTFPLIAGATLVPLSGSNCMMLTGEFYCRVMDLSSPRLMHLASH